MTERKNTSGTMHRNYIFGVYPEQGRRAGRRIAWRDSSGYIHYYFADVLGSTRAVTDSSGNTCFQADKYPGACPERSRRGQEATPAGATNTCSPTYTFTGYEYDSETGNYYAYARYYNPLLGRFMTPDPLGGSIQNPQSLNRYTYVLNNPESFTDPLGLSCQQVFMIGVGNIVDCTTYYFTGEGGLKEAYFSFFSEATGMNGCVLGWCAPTPPPDIYPYGLVQSLEKRLRAARNWLERHRRANNPFAPPSLGKRILACTEQHFGLTAGAAAAGAAAAPVPKSALSVGQGLAGASEFTSASGAVGFKLFGPSEPRIGTSVLGTTRVFGIIGRASGYVSAALAVADVGAIASCVKQAGGSGGHAFGGAGASGSW